MRAREGHSPGQLSTSVLLLAYCSIGDYSPSRWPRSPEHLSIAGGRIVDPNRSPGSTFHEVAGPPGSHHSVPPADPAHGWMLNGMMAALARSVRRRELVGWLGCSQRADLAC